MPNSMRRILLATVVPAILILGLVAINHWPVMTLTSHDDWDDTTTVRTISDADVTSLWTAAEHGELLALSPVYRFLTVIGYIAVELAILTAVAMGFMSNRRILGSITAIGAGLGLLVPIGYMRLADFVANYRQLGGDGQSVVSIGAGPLVFGIACLAAAALALLLSRMRRRSPQISTVPPVSPVESA